MSGTKAAPEGVTNPPIDDLLAHVDSKYALVIYSAKRARQINAYYSQLKEGLLEYVGPLVEAQPSDKPLSVALQEINADKLVRTQNAGGPADQGAADVADLSASDAETPVDAAELAADDPTPEVTAEDVLGAGEQDAAGDQDSAGE